MTAFLSILMSVGLPILKKTWTYLLVLLIAFWGWHKFKDWMQEPPPNPVQTRTVYKVESPTLIIVKHGLLGRRQQGLTLWGVSIPPNQYETALEQVQSYIQEGDLISTERKGNYYKVIANGVYINKELVLQGNAKINVNDKELKEAQKEAQRNRSGIWVDYKPDIPWIPWFDEAKEDLKYEVGVY